MQVGLSGQSYLQVLHQFPVVLLEGDQSKTLKTFTLKRVQYLHLNILDV